MNGKLELNSFSSSSAVVLASPASDLIRTFYDEREFLQLLNCSFIFQYMTIRFIDSIANYNLQQLTKQMIIQARMNSILINYASQNRG